MADAKQTENKTELGDNNKLYGVLCYIGILIIVPLIDEKAKKSDFVKFHINQGLVLLIAGIAGSVIFWIPLIGWIAGLAFLAIWLTGLLGAIAGEKKRVPLLGNIELYK